MFGGINPAKMQGMMKKMGISQTPLAVNRVIFEMDGSNLVIEDPSVIKIMMQGKEMYQVSGQAVEESSESISSDDVEMVMSQANVSEKKAKEALEEANGDIAEAIMKLK